MPVVTENLVCGYAHCQKPNCTGYGQQQVDATRTETAFTFMDNGGDIPGVERSTARLSFIDPADVACPACGRDRELSEHPRPAYEPLSEGLVMGPAVDDGERVAALEGELAQMRAMLQKLVEGKE